MFLSPLLDHDDDAPVLHPHLVEDWDLVSLPEPDRQPSPDLDQQNDEALPRDAVRPDKHLDWRPEPWGTSIGKHLPRPRNPLNPEEVYKRLGSAAHATDDGLLTLETAPPTREEALSAADTVRRYIQLHGRLNAKQNGIYGYLELVFKPVGIFRLGEPDAVPTTGPRYSQFSMFPSSSGLGVDAGGKIVSL